MTLNQQNPTSDFTKEEIESMSDEAFDQYGEVFDKLAMGEESSDK